MFALARAVSVVILRSPPTPQNDLSLLRCSSPAEALGLEEEALGSFDFLSQDDNTSCLSSLRKSEHR